MPVHAIDSFLRAQSFSQAAKVIWDDRTTLQRWLDVEAALAQAQAELGLIPAAAALEIRRQARVELFDTGRLAEEVRFTQHPLMPVLSQFAALCAGDAGGYLHWGATTQNILDIAAVLQLRETHTATLAHLAAMCARLSALVGEHRSSLMAGRTHGQHALPMTFGFKAAAWLSELSRQSERLRTCEPRVFVASLGGAIGTLASMGEGGLRVQARLAELLNLGAALIPVRTAADGFAEYIGVQGLLMSTLEKIAQDIVLMQRSEIAELEEPFYPGKIGSSTMPQKRNPTRCQGVISLSRLVRSRVGVALEANVQGDEGDAAASATFETILGECAVLTQSGCETMQFVLGGLRVFPERMRANLAHSEGLLLAEAVMMTLAPLTGRLAAHEVVHHAAIDSATGAAFREAVLSHPLVIGRLDRAALEAALDPQAYLGVTQEVIDRILQLSAAALDREVIGTAAR
ncbi:adenylosuccinate lyase family protein [Deinococcus sp.]|uniref:class-II fumarase/aspartase family protein n=1 Tax=Deinococcus sp. TaxID=47478 RepID=UPI0025EC5F0C|nr:adenylosuccinate lyase family protein [Deinococcus sp.]